MDFSGRFCKISMTRQIQKKMMVSNAGKHNKISFREFNRNISILNTAEGNRCKFFLKARNFFKSVHSIKNEEMPNSRFFFN